MLIVAQVVGRAAVVAGLGAHAALLPGFAVATSHLLDLADRQLEEARADAAELLRVAGREEAVVAAPVLVVLEAGLAQACVSTSAAIASPELTIVTPPAELALEHRPHERVVGAAEDHGVDAGLLERAAGALDAGERAVVDLAALLDQRGELGRGDRVELGLGAAAARARARRRRC